MCEIFNQVSGEGIHFLPSLPLMWATAKTIGFGIVEFDISHFEADVNDVHTKSLYLLASQNGILQQLAACVRFNWLCLLVGDCHTGKQSMVELFAKLSNQKLRTLHLTTQTDALELLGR